MLKGMQVNNTQADKTVMKTFYKSRHTNVDPFIPVMLPDHKFSGNGKITKKNPLGDLSWLIGK